MYIPNYNKAVKIATIYLLESTETYGMITLAVSFERVEK